MKKQPLLQSQSLKNSLYPYHLHNLTTVWVCFAYKKFFNSLSLLSCPFFVLSGRRTRQKTAKFGDLTAQNTKIPYNLITSTQLQRNGFVLSFLLFRVTKPVVKILIGWYSYGCKSAPKYQNGFVFLFFCHVGGWCPHLPQHFFQAIDCR